MNLSLTIFNPQKWHSHLSQLSNICLKDLLLTTSVRSLLHVILNHRESAWGQGPVWGKITGFVGGLLGCLRSWNLVTVVLVLGLRGNIRKVTAASLR